MDVWVQGWGLAALWVGAIALVLILAFVWAIWVKLQQMAPTPARQGVTSIPAGYEDAKGPAQPEG